MTPVSAASPVGSPGPDRPTSFSAITCACSGTSSHAPVPGHPGGSGSPSRTASSHSSTGSLPARRGKGNPCISRTKRQARSSRYTHPAHRGPVTPWHARRCGRGRIHGDRPTVAFHERLGEASAAAGGPGLTADANLGQRFPAADRVMADGQLQPGRTAAEPGCRPTAPPGRAGRFPHVQAGSLSCRESRACRTGRMSSLSRSG
jgi:hypothetical protein